MFDLPKRGFEVTESPVLAGPCAACGKIGRGEFPVGVVAPVQVGPTVRAAAVHRTPPMMPDQRTAARMGDFFGGPMAQGTVRAACENAGVRLAPTVAWIGQALQTAGVTHADETGRRVAGQRHGRHARATTRLTGVACHAKRGKEAFDARAIVSGFLGTLLHEGGKPDRDLLCPHGRVHCASLAGIDRPL